MSNLNKRGFDWLKSIPWEDIPNEVRCSFHRYPETGKGPTAPHKGCRSRDDEMDKLRKIVGKDRGLAMTEFGYHTGTPGGYTPDQQAEYVAWEGQLAVKHGLEFLVAFQINDGAPDDRTPDSNFGYRNRDGSWKPHTAAFIGSV